MDEIHAPPQAILRPSREIHDDPEQQLELVPCRSRGQPRLSNRELREYTSMLPLARFLTLLMSRPNYSIDLPLHNDQPLQCPLPVQKILRNAQDPTLENTGVRHRNVPRNDPDQMTQNPETGNQRAEAAEGDLGDTQLDPRILSHESRKKELFKLLEPVLGSDNSDSSSVLLCWGKESRCHIVPVKIPDSADDVAIWQEIRRVWYTHRGGWRARLGLFSVRKVDIVNVRPVHSASKFGANGANRYHKVSIAGRGKLKGGFVGTYTTEDIVAEKRRLEKIIANYHPQVDESGYCEYNPSTGVVDCSYNCISSYQEDEECPEMEFRWTKRKLLRLNKTRPFLTLAFYDPGVAAVNKLLDGEVINRHW